MTALRVVLGLAIVAATGGSMTATFVTPRGKPWGIRIASLVNRTVRLIGVSLARPIRRFERKDAVLATIGPACLLAQLATFLGLFLLGFTIALWPYASSLGSAFSLASAQLFTVGLVHVRGRGNSALEVFAAVTGGVAIALQIGYLPAIYQAFNRREALVTLMESRAGLPAWGPELLIRHQLVSSLDALAGLYRDWEMWSADLAESHVSYPILLFFRSPEPGYSFVLALLAILDAAALQLSLMPSSAPSEARFCLRMGFTALRRIAETLGWRYDDDPRPEADIELSFEDFAYAVDLISQTGISLERTAEQAWPHFRGWRINYESLAYRLADRIVAPRAPWSGDRRHLSVETIMPRRPPHRSPDGSVSDEARHRPSY
ncbi:MAG: hypothetical protein ACYCSF_12280 [Acidimicrobiales bacterium]